MFAIEYFNQIKVGTLVTWFMMYNIKNQIVKKMSYLGRGCYDIIK